MSSNMRIDKVCELCGSQFVARTTVTRYCGDACAKRAYKQRERMKKIMQTEIEQELIIRYRRVERRTQLSEREILSIDQTAEYLGVSRSTVSRIMKSGDIPFKRLGGRVFILRIELNKLLGL